MTIVTCYYCILIPSALLLNAVVVCIVYITEFEMTQKINSAIEDIDFENSCTSNCVFI